MAISHEGLTLEAIAQIPVVEARQPLLQWIEVGAQHPIRLAMNADADELRRVQQSLAFHGVRTEIRPMRASSSSGRFPGAGNTPLPPPTVTDDVPPGARPSQDSGLHQYRRLMAEMDAQRSTASHVVANSVSGFNWGTAIIIAIVAIAGIIFAVASRTG